MSFGADQYYFALPEPGSHLPLIAHETAHSIHAEDMGSTALFVFGYAVDSSIVFAIGGDTYKGNVSEILGHGVQDAMRVAIEDPTLRDFLEKGCCDVTYSPEASRIRRLFRESVDHHIKMYRYRR